MSAGQIAVAVAGFVIFGTAALLMGRSALGDWREGRRERDGVSLLSALEQWWLTAIAAALALAVLVALVVNA